MKEECVHVTERGEGEGERRGRNESFSSKFPQRLLIPILSESSQFPVQ